MKPEEVQAAFQRAVGVLVDEKGKIKERLQVAYASQLSLVRPQDDLPEPLREEYQAVRYALSDEGMPYGYGEHASKKLQDMPEDEAAELAQRIFRIFLQLAGLDLSPTA